ncbi:MAG: 50S ribosomal protein L11 methyltransferase, partial [Xanthomonadales bacterium]|nr:50S ribosomal protein L11 methyltransferase [Xanthomonadales bacterium]NIX13127.1 50S ribosomal protein L11 methyltransferase [Xanthomonadales bacterium]
ADRLASVLSLAPGVERPDRVILSSLPDRDWERAWLENFKPMQFGSELWIVPSGYEPPDPEGLILRLDPGLAFGTGSHPTTRLCLEWLDATDVDGREVVDYGCGSGVLGIVAALKGARRVRCVDNDPQALVATHENAERNGVAGIVETMAPEAFSGRNADLLVANILASTLQELAPRLCTAVRPGGKIALSGILAAQTGGVETAYAGCAHGFRTRELDGWILLSAIVGEALMGAE